jgi:hypothetical protein
MFSQVNYQVLKELPTQIQKQVLSDIQKEKQQKAKLTVKPLTLSTQTSTNSISKIINSKLIDSSDERLFSQLPDLEEIREIVREWIDSFSDTIPSSSSQLVRIDENAEIYMQILKDNNADIQLELLLQYFDQQIRIDKNMSNVLLLMRSLRRQCVQTRSCSNYGDLWCWVFNNQILPKVQTLTKEVYKAVLLVEPIDFSLERIC